MVRLDLAEGQELLVVAFGHVYHQVLCAFWELPGEEPCNGGVMDMRTKRVSVCTAKN